MNRMQGKGDQKEITSMAIGPMKGGLGVGCRLEIHKWHEMGKESTHVYMSCAQHAASIFPI